jgi:hypothetical protein
LQPEPLRSGSSNGSGLNDSVQESMIVEGIVTSVDDDGCLNVAPMGPIVQGDFERLLLRPFQPSTTYSNLSETRCGVFHIVDEVDIIAKAVLDRLDPLPEVEPANQITGFVLKNCCRWFEFTVDSVDSSNPRSEMPSTIVHRGERRPFFGFNRARHAVLEAAILATRLHLIPEEEVVQSMNLLWPAVQKTGGASERALFELIQDFILRHQEKEV